MTRFMMTLDDAVDLVLYAFKNGKQGDIFVQKAPAATIMDLSVSLKELYDSQSEIRIIGTRHGEKLYETLINREEIIRSEDLGEYYRIPSDDRGLNYEQYISEGMSDISEIDDYHSHNTKRLNVVEMKNLLLKLNIVRRDIKL